MRRDRKGPKRMIRIAVVLAIVFLTGHVAGLREMTSIISGTFPASEADLLAGVFYLLSWFAFVLVVPVLALAGGAELLGLEVSERLARGSGREGARRETTK